MLSVKDIQHRLGMMGMFTDAGGGEVGSADICTAESVDEDELSVGLETEDGEVKLAEVCTVKVRFASQLWGMAVGFSRLARYLGMGFPRAASCTVEMSYGQIQIRRNVVRCAFWISLGFYRSRKCEDC